MLGQQKFGNARPRCVSCSTKVISNLFVHLETMKTNKAIIKAMGKKTKTNTEETDNYSKHIHTLKIHKEE